MPAKGRIRVKICIKPAPVFTNHFYNMLCLNLYEYLDLELKLLRMQVLVKANLIHCLGRLLADYQSM